MKIPSISVFAMWLACLFVPVASLRGQWTWMHGANVPGANGYFGVQGVASPANDPRCRMSPLQWTDAQGRFWMYGGSGTGQTWIYSDLWRFDPAINEWTWIAGDTIGNQLPNYGIMTVPAPTNTPGGRMESVTWIDNSGNLWLYGGALYAGPPCFGDMWKFDMSTQVWTWESGSTLPNLAPTYGPQGVFSPLSYPGVRKECAHSVDANGHFWLFGGFSGTLSSNGAYNDIWEYDPVLNLWAWWGGGLVPGSYGTQTVSSPSNWPPKRQVWTSFDTKNNEVWLWGGNWNGGYADMWKYDIATTDWTWESGTNVLTLFPSCGDPGVIAGQCTPDTNGRAGYHTADFGFSCTDKCGNFWIMGGENPGCPGNNNNFNDLWRFNPNNREWEYISGQTAAGYTPNYGTQQVPSPSNVPGQRGRAAMWCSHGLWMFGGYTVQGFLNDMWVFAPKPVAAFSGSIVNCNFVQFTDHSQAQCGGEMHEWKWDFGDGNISTQQNPLHGYGAPGTYTVTLIATNCVDVSDTFSATVNVPAALLLSSAQVANASCAMNNGAISVSVNGIGPFTYAWTPALSASSQMSNLAQGNYSLTVTDQSNGCQLSQTFTITGTDSITAFATAIPVICQTPGAATISATGGNGVFTYAWTPNVSTDSTASGLTPGIYSVIVSDSSGCSDTVLFNLPHVVSPLTASTDSSNVRCWGGNDGWVSVSASGSIGPYSYLWQPGNFTADSVAQLPAATYSVTVTDGYGCVVTDSSKVAQPLPLIPQIIIQGNDTFCLGHSLYMTLVASQGTAPYSYTLQPANFTSSVSSGVLLQPVVSTMYTLIVTDTNGCMDSTTQWLYVEPPPVAMFEPVTSGCAPWEVTFSDLSYSSWNPITSWQWNFGDGGTSTATNPTYTYQNPGTFNVSLTVTSSSGCVGSDTSTSAVTVYPKPLAGFAETATTIFPGDAITFIDQSVGAASWWWDFGDGEHSTAQDTTHVFANFPLSGNEYHVVQIVTSNYGCMDTAEYYISLLGAEVYVPNAFSPNGDGVNDLFYLVGYGIETESMLIFDRWGNLVWNSTAPWDGTYKGSVVQEDVYVWKATIRLSDGSHKFLTSRVTVVR